MPGKDRQRRGSGGCPSIDLSTSYANPRVIRILNRLALASTVVYNGRPLLASSLSPMLHFAQHIQRSSENVSTPRHHWFWSSVDFNGNSTLIAFRRMKFLGLHVLVVESFILTCLSYCCWTSHCLGMLLKMRCISKVYMRLYN